MFAALEHVHHVSQKDVIFKRSENWILIKAEIYRKDGTSLLFNMIQILATVHAHYPLN